MRPARARRKSQPGNWDDYLAPAIANALPISGHAFMLIVGVIEIVAGIIIDLILRGHALDLVLRDFGLCLGALALARLSAVYDARAGGAPIRSR